MILGKVLTMELIMVVYFSKNGLDSFNPSNHGLRLILIPILDSLGSMKGIILLVFDIGMFNLLHSLTILGFIWSMVFSSSNFFMLDLLELSYF
jgi:hypothetical protein